MYLVTFWAGYNSSITRYSSEVFCHNFQKYIIVVDRLINAGIYCLTMPTHIYKYINVILQESPVYYQRCTSDVYSQEDSVNFACIERLDGNKMWVSEQVLQVKENQHGSSPASKGTT